MLSAIGFAMVDLRYWPILALLAAVFSLVPIFGSILSSIPAVAMGLTQSFGIGLFVLAWILGIHQLEANLLNPKMALFVLALFPQFVRPEDGAIALQIMILATVLNLIGIVVNGAVILAASRIGQALSGLGRFRRLPQILLGTVFAGLAVRLVFDARR